ncbi:hypothetical protein ACFRFH_02500 [Leifsonia sp. NPDC056824]|uniref:hypothetical protein n=1 Tax=Leifsonia sp. NPDC056824 TaxID=3345953 RepID=UPI0036C50FAF
MPLVSQYYKIAGPVPFVDVDISMDNDRFLDPHAIRLARGPQPHQRHAIECMDTFLAEVTDCVIHGRRRGEELLQRFTEPWETRLGMSAEGFYGHGGGHDVGTWIWDALTGDVEALVRVGALHQLEDLPLFVSGIDKDITSDVTSRIVYGPLADFTAEMIATYPEFTASGHRVATFTRQVWNPVTNDWEEREITLPVADGKPLLLVPRHWARRNLLMSAGRFWSTSVLSFAQFERAVVTSDGKVLKPRKEDLAKVPGLTRGRGTNIRVTKRAIETAEDLVRKFKEFVDRKHMEPTEDNDAA